MHKIARYALFAALWLLVSPRLAGAGDLKLVIGNGRVTLIAQDVPIRQILAEWARVGQTTIVNGEKIVGAPVTLQLVDVPEAVALDAVLRAASGYVAAPRDPARPGASVYDRIMILAASRAPAASASGPGPTPTPFNRMMMPPVVPQPDAGDDDSNGVATPQVGVFPPAAQPPPVTPPQTSAPQATPGFAPVQPGQQQPVMTAPRPGMLPTPQPPPVNPYQPFTPQPPVKKPVGGGPGGSTLP